MVGNRIGPYKFLREIGADRLGQIYQARDVSTKKLVTIRALNRAAASRPETIERLYSQAKTLALLNHPHIARIFGFIRHNEQLFLVMEFIEGESFQSILKAKARLDPAVALAYFRQILSGVAFAHGLGVVHGDLKPANLMVTPFGRIKILDFAIAPILGDTESAAPLAGTSPYRAPEQARGEPPDARSDIYSLGVMLYESLAGKPPFDEQSGSAASLGAATPLRPSLFSEKIPGWLDEIVLRAFAPAAADRFQTAAAMSLAMDASVDTGLRAAQKRRRWTLQPARRVASASVAATRRANTTVGNGIGAAKTKARAQSAAATATVRRGAAKIQPLVWTRRGAKAVSSKAGATAAALKQIFLPGLQSLGAAGRRLYDHGGRAAGALRRAPAGAWNTLNARLAARPRRQRPKVLPEIFPKLWLLAGSSRGWIRMRLTDLFEAGWQRYAAAAIVVVSAAIEIFVFGGTNTLLLSDSNRVAVSTQNGGAESFLDPLPELKPQPVRTNDRQPAPELAKPTKTVNTVRKAPSKPALGEPDYQDAWVGKRTVTYRAEAERPRLLEAKPSEPVPQRRATESAVQLNVKWEN